jgi:hypothetical protein
VKNANPSSCQALRCGIDPSQLSCGQPKRSLTVARCTRAIVRESGRWTLW